MHFFFDFLYTYPILALAQTGFTIWMLIDVNRRAVEQFWFWVILWFQPIGPWAYFFLVKMKDLRGGVGLPVLANLVNPRPSLEELSYRAEQTPTLANHLALSERLIEKNEFSEALQHLEFALAKEPDHCQVLFLTAKCYLEQGSLEKALPLLERIVKRDRAWSDYSAWRLMIKGLGDHGDKASALQSCRELQKISPSMQNQCLLAEHLLDAGLDSEAHNLLTRSLEEYRYAPHPIRKLNRQWASKAKRLFRTVSR